MWHNFECENFEFKNRKAIVVFPDKEKSNGKWLLKTEYWDAFPNLETEMVKRGWHLAFIENKNRWCLDEDLDIKAEFSEYISKKYGLSKKCIPVGMSCGGLFAVKFAAKYPDMVSALYLDAPVLNLLSCPAALGLSEDYGMFDEFKEATGVTMSELICYREHPIDKLDILLENKLPVVLVYGKDDTVVPYCENGMILDNFYKKNRGCILSIGKDNCGHHPHGLDTPGIIADFLENNAL